MIVSQSDVDQMNRQPLNLRARALLQQAGRNPNMGEMYLPQLAQWALGQQTDLDRRQRVRIQSTLDAASRMLPLQAMQFLTGESPDRTEALLPDHALDSLTPEQAGGELLHLLLNWTTD